MGAADDFVKQLLNRKKSFPAQPAHPTQPTQPAENPVYPVAPALTEKTVYPVTPSCGVRLVRDVPAALPTVRATTSISVPLLNTAAPAARKFLRTAPAEHSDYDRSLRDEKVLFVRLVEECKDGSAARISDQNAVLAVIREHAQSFPLLTVAGKNGKSALHYNNLRNWRDGNPKRPGLRNPVTGKVDYSRSDLLLKNYGCDERRRYGDDRFWTQLLAACNNPSAVQIRKTYRLQAAEWMKHTPGAEIPSLAQVYAELRKIPRRMLDLNRRGPNYYQQHIRDYNERDPESIRPNEGWVADTQMCDFMIRVETGADSSGGKIYSAVRPWICVIEDIKSEHVIAWEMGIGAIDNRVIRNAFGRGVWQYGRPFVFLTDNGKDYLKQGFTTPVVFTPDLANSKVYPHSVMIALEIEHRKALAYNGRAKIVERFFDEMAKYYRVLRGYVGRCPAERPAEADVWTKPVTNEYLMGIEEACDAMADFIDIYHHTPARGSKFLNGMTPEEAFSEELRVKRPMLSMAELYRRFLLPEARPRIMDPRGSGIQVDGKRYVTLRRDREKMWAYDNRPVMVKFDLNSRDYCFLFDLDGTYLTAAHRPQLIPYFCRTPEEKALLAQHQEWIAGEIATLNTYTAEKTKGFHKLDVSTCLGLPPEEFEARAKLRIVGKAHSVKGETHNPTVRVTAGEHQEMEAARGEDIKKVCTNEKVQHVTPEIVQNDDMKAFNRLLVNHLTASEEPEKPSVDMTQAYQTPENEEKNNDENVSFNPYDL